MSQHTRTVSFSVLSFNTLGTPFFAPLITARYKKLSELLEKSDYDVLCLQEVTTYYHVSLLKKYLKSYPYHAYKKLLLGPKGGVVIFSKLPLASIRYDSFKSLGSVTMYTQLVRNGVLSCQLKGLPVRILNTHLISDFEYNSSEDNKYYKYVKRQMREVGVLMNTFAESGDTILAAGDYNVAKYDPMYRTFLDDAKAEDVFAKNEQPTYFYDRYQWHYQAARTVRIDYIFLLDKYDRMQIESTEHVFTEKVHLTPGNKNYLSDHIGLLSKFSIRK